MSDEVVVKEVWMPIEQVRDRHPGGKRKYEVSSLGRVRQSYYFDRNGNFHGVVIVRQRADERGNSLVFISGQEFYVATLVAKAFIRKQFSGGVVRHHNGNLSDNRVDNLFWAETREVEMAQKPAEKVHKGGRQPIAVRQYTMDGKFVREHRCATDAAKLLGKAGSAQILHCCRREHGYNSSYGFLWRFPSDDEFFLRDEGCS